MGIGPSTGCEWLKRWNEEGLNGLIPKYDGGKSPKLSVVAYKILDEILEKTPNLTTDIVNDILKSEFGVEFSDRHISRFFKKLNYIYNIYRKPLMIYSKMPDDAEDQLKKTSMIDPNLDIIDFDHLPVVVHLFNINSKAFYNQFTPLIM